MSQPDRKTKQIILHHCQQLDDLHRALLRCVGHSSAPAVVQFSLKTCASTSLSVAEQAGASNSLCQETASRLDALRQPRNTRDPFADEWEQILAFVAAHPECSGGALFREVERLQQGRHTPEPRSP